MIITQFHFSSFMCNREIMTTEGFWRDNRSRWSKQRTKYSTCHVYCMFLSRTLAYQLHVYDSPAMQNGSYLDGFYLAYIICCYVSWPWASLSQAFQSRETVVQNYASNYQNPPIDQFTNSSHNFLTKLSLDNDKVCQRLAHHRNN